MSQSTQCFGPLCLCFLSISTNRIPRLGRAVTHLNLNVHELFSELFEYLQKENLVRWFFYWLYIFSKDGNIFPYFSTLYSFISSKYLAKWNSKIRHSNNPFEFVDMCVMHHLQYYLPCMEYSYISFIIQNPDQIWYVIELITGVFTKVMVSEWYLLK